MLAMNLRAAYAHLRRRSNLVFAPFEMTSDQYVLLTVLAQQGEATQQELVRECYSDTATIGTMVARLQEKGLISRTPHPKDGRAWRVGLTRSGQRLTEAMRRSSSRLRAKLVRLFNERELQMLMEFLARLAGALRPPARRAAPSKRQRPKARHLGIAPAHPLVRL